MNIRLEITYLTDLAMPALIERLKRAAEQHDRLYTTTRA